jgi:tagaturonate reductase
MPVAYLHGLRTVKACFTDEKIKDFISSVIFNEIVPTLNADPTELKTYAESVIERFTNPFIEHKLLSISLNSIAKFRVRILPTILKYYEINQSLPPGLMRSFAALVVFYRGRWQQTDIELKDEKDVLIFFRKAWSQAELSLVAKAILENTKLWSLDLNQIPGMHLALLSHLTQVLAEEDLLE